MDTQLMLNILLVAIILGQMLLLHRQQGGLRDSYPPVTHDLVASLVGMLGVLAEQTPTTLDDKVLALVKDFYEKAAPETPTIEMPPITPRPTPPAPDKTTQAG